MRRGDGTKFNDVALPTLVSIYLAVICMYSMVIFCGHSTVAMEVSYEPQYYEWDVCIYTKHIYGCVYI